MTRIVGGLASLTLLLVLAAGCSQDKPKSQLSGKVTFKGQPVPAGYITFMPVEGAATMAEIKNGAYDTSQHTKSGFLPGANIITIAGFDGQPQPNFPRGKQIFNPHQVRATLAAGEAQKDFTVPETAAEDLRIEPDIDP